MFHWTAIPGRKIFNVCFFCLCPSVSLEMIHSLFATVIEDIIVFSCCCRCLACCNASPRNDSNPSLSHPNVVDYDVDPSLDYSLILLKGMFPQASKVTKASKYYTALNTTALVDNGAATHFSI